MQISYWPSNIALNATEPYHALIDSISKTDTIVKESWTADAAVIWSVLWNGRMRPNSAVWSHYRQRNLPVIVVEIGSLMRGTTWKISANGINRLAVWPTFDPAFTRHIPGVELEPVSNGDHILICMQQQRSEQWAGMPAPEKWLENIIVQLRKQTNLPIKVRPHPRNAITVPVGVEKQQVKMIGQDQSDFAKVVARAQAVVCHNNSVGVESVRLGKRVICHSSSLAWPVSVTAPDQTPPDRSQWWQEMLQKEWTVSEIASGVPWQRLRHALYG